MVLDSLASIGNLSLQRSSVSIALHGDRKCCGTSVVTLDLPLCRAEDVNVSPGPHLFVRCVWKIVSGFDF
jgi:hypothetical protein